MRHLSCQNVYIAFDVIISIHPQFINSLRNIIGKRILIQFTKLILVLNYVFRFLGNTFPGGSRTCAVPESFVRRDPTLKTFVLVDEGREDQTTTKSGQLSAR